MNLLRKSITKIAAAISCLTMLASMGLACPKVEFKPASSPVDTYDFLEVAIHVSQSDAKNPFTETSVEGTFSAKGLKPIAVDGFCDSSDGSIFRIRFMPSKPGDYEYKICYREKGFEQIFQGEFQAREGKRKGVVRLDSEFPSHFQWEATKERFFWNGTTAYWLAGWDDATIKESINRLDQLKVTRVRAALNGRVKDGRAWFENVFPSEKFSFLLNPWVAKNPSSIERPEFDVTRFNVSFWQKYERLLRHAWNKDMVISVIFYVDGSRPGVDPFGKSGMGGADEQRYYRYAMARLSAFSNVMWDIANEYRLFRNDDWAEKMGGLVKQWDPYKHLTSTHGHGDFRFRTSAWADFAMFQSWDESGGYEFMLKNRQEQEKTGRIIPQVNEEYGYEDHYPQGWGGNRVAPARSADSRRRIAWQISMAGGYQTTGERADTPNGGGWITGRGGDDTMLEFYGHIFDFFTSITWWKLQPDPKLLASFTPGNKASPDASQKVMASRNAEGDLAVIYLPLGGVVSLNGDLLKDGLKPMWFSPKDGGIRVARALRPKVYRTPDANDWVLLFRTPCNCSFREYDDEFEK